MIKNLVNILTSPTEAFRSISEKPTVLAPFVLLLGVAIFTQYWVMYTIDFDYFIEETVRQTALAQDVAESQVRQGLSTMTPALMGTIGAVATAVLLSVILVIWATYLNLIARLGDDRHGFKHFLSLACWTAMPLLFSNLATILTTAFNRSGELSQSQLTPLSFNNLFFQTSGPLAGILNSTDPMMLWSLVLSVLGYRYLSGTSTLKAVLVVLIPMLLIYGIWLSFLLL